MEARDKSRVFETVQAIGGFEMMKRMGPDGQETAEEVQVWETGDDCKECLEDIVRFLRHDTPALKPVRTQLAQWEVVQQHILPLFSWESENQEILFQVLVMLTMPDIGEAANKDELVESHQAYKEAFLKQNYLAVLANATTYPMQRLLETGAEDERTQEASKFLELLLCLLRNLLVVPDSGSAAHNGPRAHMQEEFIRQLRSERFLDAIIVLCRNVQQEQNRAYAPLLLDILCALFARSRPQDISAARATAAAAGAEAVLKTSLSSRLKLALQKEKSASDAARTSATLKHLARPLPLAPALVTAASATPTSAKAMPANAKLILDASHMRKQQVEPRVKKASGQTADAEMAADVLLVLSGFADKLLKEGAFNALMAVIAATLASGKKSREEAMAEQENRAQYYTAIGWLCEYASVLVASQSSPEWLLSGFEEVFDATLFTAIGRWVASQIEARAWHLLSPALRVMKGMILFADALYFSSPDGSESRLVGKGFLMNTVHDPDNFLDLLVMLQHRIGAPSTTRRFGVLVMELIERVFQLLDRWKDGPLFTLGRRRAAQSTAEDENPQKQESSDEENEEDDQPRKEIPLDAHKYLRRFITSDTISNYLSYLKNYDVNPEWLNTVILNFFDRLVREGFIRMFIEGRTLCFLKEVLADGAIRGLESFRPLVRLANEVFAEFRRLTESNPFMWVEILFSRNQRFLYQLDGEVAPVRTVQKEVNPFEKATVESVFAAAGVDQGDRLLLGEITLKALAEMPDEEIKKMPIPLDKSAALIERLAPFREWLEAEKVREAKRKEREDRRKEREEREKREEALRLERQARGEGSSGSDASGAVADEDSADLRRAARIRERDLQKAKEAERRDDGLQIDNDGEGGGGGKRRVIDDNGESEEAGPAKGKEGTPSKKTKTKERKKEKEREEKEKPKKQKKATPSKESDEEPKERKKEKRKGSDREEKEEGKDDKHSKERRSSQGEADGERSKPDSASKKKNKKQHNRDPAEEKEEARKRKRDALAALLARRGGATIFGNSNTLGNSNSASSAPPVAFSSATASVSIPDPTSHLAEPSQPVTPAPSGDAADAPSAPAAASTPISVRKRIQRKSKEDEDRAEDEPHDADEASTKPSTLKARRVLLDDDSEKTQ